MPPLKKRSTMLPKEFSSGPARNNCSILTTISSVSWRKNIRLVSKRSLNCRLSQWKLKLMNFWAIWLSPQTVSASCSTCSITTEMKVSTLTTGTRWWSQFSLTCNCPPTVFNVSITIPFNYKMNIYKASTTVSLMEVSSRSIKVYCTTGWPKI